jgi:hypothetical protein
MKRAIHRIAYLPLVLVTLSMGVASFAADSNKKPGQQQPKDQGPQVDAAPVGASMAALRDGFRWGMSPVEVIDAHAKGTSSILWKDYDERLLKLHPGPEQTQVEHERDALLDNFKSRALTKFERSGSGWESSPIRGEYSVGNHESLVLVERKGKRRFFFFINDRLYKIYDEVALAPNGPMGATWAEAYQKAYGLAGGVAGRAMAAEPAKGKPYQAIDWKDADSRGNYLRLIDRSAEKFVGVVITDFETERNLGSLRSHKELDPMDLDPGVAAVTGGSGRTDPNSARTSPSASASSSARRR